MLVREPDVTAVDQVMVARQVVMDRHRRVYGYDLLYHAAPGFEPEADSGLATARLLTDAFTAIGLDALADGKLSFIRLDRQTLLSGVPTLPAPERVVFVLYPEATPDAELMRACRELRQQGFGLAVSSHMDRLDQEATKRLLSVADYLRVDVRARAVDPLSLARVLSSASRRVIPIATHVESQSQFARALENGFEYVQGCFFGEPVIKEGRAIPAPQLARMKLVQGLQDPDLSIDEIESLIKPDTALCYRTLLTANSAANPHGSEIKSIREALLRVGREPIRRWATLWAFSDMSRHASSELLALSAIRGRFCELLAEQSGRSVGSSEAFLLGLCSLLDAILNRPMKDLVRELPLPADVSAALLGEPNALRALLDCTTAYGSGEWERATSLAVASGVDGKNLPKTYVHALRWARAIRTPG